ncbi:hypothetical protein Hamer_G005373 [Homarus americanus]|uniref:Uncharacterized protein n=1 Tax=Homarus americanus TaxID=6706 RepID=A0A8J5K5N4_HOMAM|nr:hypothetical protein Hamer_G005373 [Homarus americanus]
MVRPMRVRNVRVQSAVFTVVRRTQPLLVNVTSSDSRQILRIHTRDKVSFSEARSASTEISFKSWRFLCIGSVPTQGLANC